MIYSGHLILYIMPVYYLPSFRFATLVHSELC